jgi:hypothetical protein
MKCYTTAVELGLPSHRLNHLLCVHKIRSDYDRALTSPPFYTWMARAEDKHQDSIQNANEWRAFVDDAAMNEARLHIVIDS